MAAGFKKALEKIALRQAVGVYVGDQEVTVSRVALSLAGPVELSSQTEPYDPDHLGSVLERMLKPMTSGRRWFRPAVSVGLPTLRVFFATKPVQVTDRDSAPQVLLHEVLRSSNVNVDEMEVDMIRAQPGRKPLALLVAARRKFLSGLLSAVGRCDVRPHRTEPAPFALVRLAASTYRGPRKAKTVVRIFLGATHGVAVLVAGEIPLSWRAFELPEGSETATICSTAKAIQIVARFRGDVGAPDAVLFHGRPDLTEALNSAPFTESLGVRSQAFPGPGYDPQSIALGLAIGCQQGEEAFDLSRALKPRASIWQVFPIGDVALQAALLVCVTLFLHSKHESVQQAFRMVRSESSKHKWMDKVGDEKLEKEKKDLTLKVETIRDYLSSRILWSAYTRDVSVRLPESILLTSMSGVCELEAVKGKSKPKKSFTFKLSAPISKGQGIPREIDSFLGAIRNDAMLQRDFSVIELADLRWNQSSAGSKVAVADFTVNCLPGAGKTRPARDGDKGKK